MRRCRGGFSPQPGEQNPSCPVLGLREGPLLPPHDPFRSLEPYEAQQAESMPFFQGLRLVMSHGPYVKLIAGFLFTSLAFMVSGWGLRCSSSERVRWEWSWRRFGLW